MNRSMLCATWMLLILTGCGTMAPEYRRPEVPDGATFATGSKVQADAPPPQWDEFISDSKLKKLIALSLRNNRDLRVALLNVEKTQAQFQIVRAGLLPHLNATAAENAALTPASLASTGKRTVSHAYSVGLGFSAYEIDLFGRVRSLEDAALEQYLSNQEARYAAQVSLIGQLAVAYVALDADHAHVAVATDNLANQQAALNLIRKRFGLGVASSLDVSDAESAVSSAQIDLARYKDASTQDADNLTLLLGTSTPNELLPEGNLSDVTVIKDIAGGLSSTRLQNRPDVLAAEHQLQSANANIGAARAAFFPSITLTSSIGTSSNQLSGLFKAGSSSWGFVPQINLPIFDAGTNSANLTVAKVNRDIYLAQYEKSIEVAFREVADALADHDALEEEIAAQRALVMSTQSSYTLTDARYQRGIENYLAVLTAQRVQYAAQQNLISLKAAQSENLLTLYKVLGGGGH